MEKWREIKQGFNILLEIVFLVTYVVTIIMAILDIFGVLQIISDTQWTKILVMVFGTVGMVVLSDKRKMEADISPQIDVLLEEQKRISEVGDKVDIALNNLEHIFNTEMEIKYFPDKTQFYLFLTEILLKLPSGAKVDVTSFEKNYNVSYDIGEDKHIESFMETWSESVLNGKILVRQLVHITSTQDYEELRDRVNTFKDNFNFTVSAIIGMPIAPFFDYMILNQEYVVVGMSDDISSPYNLSFGYVIKCKELALNFQNHFNIYWSGQFSTIIKDKDEIKKVKLENIQKYVYEVEHNVDFKKYNSLMLCIYHINDCNNKILPFLENLNLFYRNICYDILQNELEDKINECADFVNKRMKEFIIFKRGKAAELISKMIFNAKKNIYAVSLDIDGNEFWISEEGKKVFQSNINAMARNRINIQRVFVCSEEEREKLKETISEQIKAGITLYYTEYKQGMGGAFEDFLIVDNEALLIFYENEIKVSINNRHIKAYYKKFVHYMNMGNKI